MENASKALIIAGAILISILLISLGIIMYNSATGTTDKAADTSEAMEKGAAAGVDSIKESLGLEVEEDE